MKKKLFFVFLLLLAASFLFVCPASAAVSAGRTVNQPQRNDYLTINLIYGSYNP